MIDRSKPQSPSIRLSLLLVVLGASVFLWGLGYKLSLYDTHPSNIHRIPEAKLLSRDNDPSVHESVRLNPVKPDSLHAGTYFTLFRLLPLVTIATLRAKRDGLYYSIPKPWCLQSRVIQHAFYFRPPPALRCQIIR